MTASLAHIRQELSPCATLVVECSLANIILTFLPLIIPCFCYEGVLKSRSKHIFVKIIKIQLNVVESMPCARFILSSSSIYGPKTLS